VILRPAPAHVNTKILAAAIEIIYAQPQSFAFIHAFRLDATIAGRHFWGIASFRKNGKESIISTAFSSEKSFVGTQAAMCCDNVKRLTLSNLCRRFGV
jgi:hypothetical protein